MPLQKWPTVIYGQQTLYKHIYIYIYTYIYIYGVYKYIWLIIQNNNSVCLMFLVSSDIVQQSWALLGKRAALSCNIKPDDPNEQVATVLWYRGTQGEPIFT